MPTNNSPVNKLTQQRSGPGQSFLDSLNAKLAQQHISNAQQPQLKANKIRQLINSKAQVRFIGKSVQIWFSFVLNED